MVVRIFKAVTSFTCIALLAACADETPFLSKKDAYRTVEEINVSRDPFHAVKNIVAIINNNIYYFNRLDTIPRQLTKSAGLQKTNVKLSPDKTKVAYINESGHPVIISSKDGKVLETLTQYNYITQMDWVKNSATLYMLIGREVVLHGDQVSFFQPETYTSWDDVSSFSMNSIGDQGYFISRYSSYRDVFEYHSTVKGLDETYNNFQGDRFDYIDFYGDQGDFLLGHSDPYGIGLERVVCVQNYNLYYAYEWDGESMQTPEFNAEHEILLFATVDGDEFYIKAVYLGTKAYEGNGVYDVLTKTLTDHASSTHIYLDWVQ